MAIKWYQFAARQGCRLSMVKLGKAYRSGDGVAKNKIKSHICFGAAAWFGDDMALFAQEHVSRTMTRPQINEARNKLLSMVTGVLPFDF